MEEYTPNLSRMSTHVPASAHHFVSANERTALARLISVDRLRTYRFEAHRSGCDQFDLYLWDRDASAAALADIAIIEVALRNAMSDQLSKLAGKIEWYTLDIGLDDRSLASLKAAWTTVRPPRTHGMVVAQLMFGF